eukprot:6198800-Pleurochrysis_carterae.AAC.1
MARLVRVALIVVADAQLRLAQPPLRVERRLRNAARCVCTGAHAHARTHRHARARTPSWIRALQQQSASAYTLFCSYTHFTRAHC